MVKSKRTCAGIQQQHATPESGRTVTINSHHVGGIPQLRAAVHHDHAAVDRDIAGKGAGAAEGQDAVTGLEQVAGAGDAIGIKL